MSNFSFCAFGRFARALGALAFVAAIAAPLGAQAQATTACGPGVKAEVAAMLDSAAKLGSDALAKAEAEAYIKYQPCAKIDAAQFAASEPFYTAARQCGAKVAYLGSLYYEEMPCCGYDPQRRTFACPVKIKQPFGFGGSPLPGSREYVLNCVADPNGTFRPVGDDSVHLSNSAYAPSWQFAVVANGVNNLQLIQPMNGAPRKARSILSWNLRPTSCEYQPIWGNVIDYQIRLDQ